MEGDLENAVLINQLYTVLFSAAILAGPPLFAATILGLVVAILQAVTQIQDQSLPQTIKITAIAIVMILAGAMLSAPFFQVSEQLFSDFHKWVG